jgi:diguanylate cyclase (GGDEF)-like protein
LGIKSIDYLIVIASVVASLLALIFAIRYRWQTHHGQSNIAWLLLLGGMFGLTASEIADATATLRTDVFMSNLADLFGLAAEVGLATGFVRLYGVELERENAQRERLRQRAHHAESLSTAALQLAASLALPEVLGNLTKQALEITGADFAAVYRVTADMDAQPTEIILTRRNESEPNTLQRELGSASRWMIDSGEPFFIEDLTANPRFQNSPALARVVSLAVIPLQQNAHIIGTLMTGFGARHSFDENERRLLTTFAQHAALAMYNAELHRAVEALAVTDALTGIANRRRFEQKLANEILRARRYHDALSLVIFDLDNFKQINDRYGHLAGDAVLCAMARTLTRASRETDLVARIGGEEFALILPETGAVEARMVAERIRRSLEETPVVWDGQTLVITCSAGVFGATGLNVPGNSDEMYRLADAALYQAKELGRNCVVMQDYTIS